jgi:hypothetical protein
MKMRASIIGVLLIVAAAAFASAQESLPAGHVHAYTGKVLTYSRDGVIVVALAERGDIVDHVWVYQPVIAEEVPVAILPRAIIDFSHDGLTVRAGKQYMAYWLDESAIGLAEVSDMIGVGLTQEEVDRNLDGFVLHKTPPPTPGPGCAVSCSVTCSGGSGSITCAQPFCASCSCFGGWPQLVCIGP